jgi:hypothetical protein
VGRDGSIDWLFHLALVNAAVSLADGDESL